MISVILVEDDPAHIELIRRAVEESDREIDLVYCHTLAEARCAIELNVPSLVIADLNLPDGKGTDLIQFSDAAHRYPLILMTSFGDEKIAVDAIKAGALDYVVKGPEAFRHFPSTIKRVLREWQHITDKLQAQEALQLKEREKERIINSMDYAVFTIDQTGLILSTNTAAETLFGYESSELIGHCVTKLLSEYYAKEYSDHLREYLETGDASLVSLGQEVGAMDKNQETFPMRLTVTELPPDENGIRRFVATCQDLTQIKQQEEQIRRTQKMDALGKLTGGIAHDYNNILGIVLGYAELIDACKNEPDKVSEYATNIAHVAERGAKLARKLLSFSRHKQPNQEVIDVNQLLLEQQHLLEKILTARIHLSLDLGGDLWSVELDSSDLEDAIVNMSINALHATPLGGELAITTSNVSLNEKDAIHLGLEMGDYVLLNFMDNGSGIAPLIKEKIFDPFYTTKGELGTGLGLSQVYGFVSRSGGAIKLYSELGQGSRFAIYFPKSTRTRTKKQNGAMAETSMIAGSETVLVVDDEQAMVNLTRETLMTHGYHVIAANDGLQALRLLEEAVEKNEEIDLIISDVIMPNMDGYQLAAEVSLRYPRMKMLIVSGYAELPERANLDKSLSEKILHKPYSSNVLLERVRHVLDNNSVYDSLFNRSILVMDDDEDMQILYKINLKKLGCTVISASSAAEAFDLYLRSLATDKPIDMMILDLYIPGGIGGTELVNKVRNINPSAKIIVASGDSAGPEMMEPQEYGFDGALDKSFSREKIKRVLVKTFA